MRLTAALARSTMLLSATALALAACSTASATPTLSPVTGIVVPSSVLAGPNGCGSESGSLYKYAAVVDALSRQGGGTASVGLAKGVYDCWVDGLFLGGNSTALPVGSDGTASYCVEVVALEASEYEAQKAAVDELASATSVLDIGRFRGITGKRYECTATLRQDVTTQAACTPSARPCQH